MREWKIPGPLAPDDPLYEMLGMAARQIWYAVKSRTRTPAPIRILPVMDTAWRNIE